ncbi:MAG TPA: hypothetical protein VGM37_19110 [Armatimonadota bacterium]|jgi:predicted flap endonuclease-1-like 5' DNA nuclease
MSYQTLGLMALLFLPSAAQAAPATGGRGVTVIRPTEATRMEARMKRLEARIARLERENAALRGGRAAAMAPPARARILAGAPRAGLTRQQTQKLAAIGPRIAAAMTAAQPQMDQAMAQIGPQLENSLSQLGPQLESSLSNLGPTISEAMAQVGPAVEAAMKAVGPAMESAMQAAKQPGAQEAMSAEDLAELKGLGPEIRQSIQEGLTEALQSLKEERSAASTDEERKALDGAIQGLEKALQNQPR